MKMVKSLLLGSAAGLVAVAGAQAADLPVKAKPVQYVKICSLYGAGFYYIPGTDTCLKIGGWVRQYLGVNGQSLTNGALSGNVNTRASANGWTWKARGYITADARSQTEFGTLRSYISVGTSFQAGNGGQGNQATQGVGTGGFNANRAFIQLAGFTFGVAQSFYDLYPTPALSYWGGMANPSSDTSDGGQTVSAYTAQFGNGLSASLSLEAPRSTSVVGPLTIFTPTGFSAGSQANGSTRYPDVVANLRMDASWGAAQIMGGIHDNVPLYYGSTTATGGPNYATGYFAGAGVKINVPMIGPGDYFSAQFNYTVGAAGYQIDGAATGTAGATTSNTANNLGYGSYGFETASGVGFGIVSDAVYGTTGNMELTTVWGVNAAYEHFWNKRWQTSVYGAYVSTSYDSNANAILCGMEATPFTAGMTLANGCNNNWQYWVVGSRTQFNVDSQTYIGLDIIYTDLVSASNNSGVVTTATNGTQLTGVRALGDQSAWMAEFRFHRNFYP